MARFILAALSNPVNGKENECGDWYDQTHIPDMLEVPGVLSAQRFQLLRLAPSKTFHQRYLCLYNFEAENEESAKAIIEILNKQNLPLSTALAVETVALAVYKATGPEQWNEILK
ncbi:DUF4286 family protein [Noviherbaspirillum sedimenti]|uniref:Uncharacterized protein n=1 Tax=Noviherbaspirillum sedimenti TaxID=2320865 RepID=A0A3A3G2F9_9BURK|nr:DUF4286 family protein [Noviherbaspirillum sedimenti]RJG02653.1 hypothetical protein D3878_14600 [Noviherbaspirillum sedimenti]